MIAAFQDDRLLTEPRRQNGAARVAFHNIEPDDAGPIIDLLF